ncbi:hypothetical protein NL676_030391 [Syzygium grande]|nr:hypothetical protein NL676_030391 [Syzygium grande]
MLPLPRPVGSPPSTPALPLLPPPPLVDLPLLPMRPSLSASFFASPCDSSGPTRPPRRHPRYPSDDGCPSCYGRASFVAASPVIDRELASHAPVACARLTNQPN